MSTHTPRGVPLTVSRRTRVTPFTPRVKEAGVSGYTVYNHMLLATSFRGVEEDYQHLRASAQVWDVSCQRQVQLTGPDAGRLAQLLTVRDLSHLEIGRCAYAPVVDHRGCLINDPVVIRVGGDRYWFSISDSDLGLWAAGLAAGMGLAVEVAEPEVYPLAVQGPKAEMVTARVMGETVRRLGFFRWAWCGFRGRDLLVARSGWSSQNGFEIYLDNVDLALPLWDELMDVGLDEGVGPGCPNLIDRIEAGLLSYGTDATREHSALEAGLDRFCSLDSAAESIGKESLRAEAGRGVARRVCGVSFDARPPAVVRPLPVTVGDERVGEMTSAAWSPRLGHGVGLAMLRTPLWNPGTEVEVQASAGPWRGRVVSLPFPLLP